MIDIESDHENLFQVWQLQHLEKVFVNILATES